MPCSYCAKWSGRSQQDDQRSLYILSPTRPLDARDGRLRISAAKKQRPERGAEIPVVVISAIPPVNLDGVEAILRKPIRLDQLMETVRHFV